MIFKIVKSFSFLLLVSCQIVPPLSDVDWLVLGVSPGQLKVAINRAQSLASSSAVSVNKSKVARNITAQSNANRKRGPSEAGPSEESSKKPKMRKYMPKAEKQSEQLQSVKRSLSSILLPEHNERITNKIEIKSRQRKSVC